jgi:UDP-N-acetylmuramate-alanine ligase
LLNSLNDNEYFAIIQKNVVANVKLKMQDNELTLKQIDDVLNSFSNEVNKTPKNGNLVYYNENTHLDEVLKTKYNLVSEQGNRRIELVNYQKIIKDVSVITNIEKGSSINFVLPLVFVMLFIFGKLFLGFYKRQATRLKETTSN